MKELFIKTEKQREWLEKLKALEQPLKEHAQENDEQSLFPHAHIQKLREIGYTKITLPKEHGGEGLDIYDAVLFQETLGSYDGSTALSIGWTLSTVGDLFESKSWPQEKLEQFAKEVANGAIINKVASEVVTGSPIRGGRPATTAVKKGNKWVINGHKSYATCSPELDYFIITAWIPELEKVGNFLIHKDTEGFSIKEAWDVVAMKATGSHDLILDNVEVDESALVEIPEYKTGFKLNGWLLIIPATYLGVAQAARDYAVEFANRHSPNSIEGTIAQLPNVQTLIGEIDLLLTQARFAIYGAAQGYIDLRNKGELEAKAELIVNAVNIAKYTVINNAINVVDKAMRVVGIKSLQRNNPLQRYYRDVRAGLHNPPMDDLTIKKLAEYALKQS
ncbi:acyl-CoA dehydrogenase family protein [Ureibacillus sp. FSL K6-8385]|uniref:Acyl-CoA dehydrogenase n=1 Tax=Ureibacillus terrenus TaxID=118246 RepID=A0A540V2B4_9BACL|nr:acyl-CoA dehydrogenase family protein [Ureibacillus terrenus]MED3661340.1 acyl-CoA/acyl-ACP dehydrogenase [Ureibacillus terrenus]MED3764188.1 acyl-CoA/acyl-ACP dehydrogenase [Ureibacillus terrenus]TQE90858.1 acyl-CoA dehydrogenase [Ureibacillus terrenus]